MKKLKENWKVLLTVLARIFVVILLCVLNMQSAQNKAFALEEQVNTAESDINYNKHVKEYNRYVKRFPIRIFLDMVGYEVQTYPYLDWN